MSADFGAYSTKMEKRKNKKKQEICNLQCLQGDIKSNTSWSFYPDEGQNLEYIIKVSMSWNVKPADIILVYVKAF